jgi:hypothetical protein
MQLKVDGQFVMETYTIADTLHINLNPFLALLG